jgi:hypothetical protein
MGWTFRRSFNLGPFRINLSRKGAGTSVGIHGFRVGQDASGRKYSQISIPGTGIYRRDYYRPNLSGQKPTNTPIQVNQPTPAPQQQAPNSTTINPSGKYFIILVSLAGLLWMLLRLILK